MSTYQDSKDALQNKIRETETAIQQLNEKSNKIRNDIKSMLGIQQRLFTSISQLQLEKLTAEDELDALKLEEKERIANA